MPDATEPEEPVERYRSPIAELEIANHNAHTGQGRTHGTTAAGPVERAAGRRLVKRGALRRTLTGAASGRTMLTRILPFFLCVTSFSCANDPPPAPPPDPHDQNTVLRLNAAKMALKKEERKLYLLKRDLEPLEQAAAYHVFSTTLPQGLTIKGLHTVYLDPRRGGDGINFEEPDDRTDAEKDNLQKVREFANKFAAECRQPDSPTAKKVAAEIDALPVAKELRQQQELVERLRRERNEAEAAVPLDQPHP